MKTLDLNLDNNKNLSKNIIINVLGGVFSNILSLSRHYSTYSFHSSILNNCLNRV
jgi:hypothetical protein